MITFLTYVDEIVVSFWPMWATLSSLPLGGKGGEGLLDTDCALEQRSCDGGLAAPAACVEEGTIDNV